MKTFKITITGEKGTYEYTINVFAEPKTRTDVSTALLNKDKNTNPWVIEQVQLGNYTIKSI